MKGAARVKKLGLKYATPYGTLHQQNQFYIHLLRMRTYEADDEFERVKGTMRAEDAWINMQVHQWLLAEEAKALRNAE